MTLLGLGTLLLMQSIWDDPAPKGRWAASTQQLASGLLPPEMAADAVSHVVGRGITQGGPPSSVRFEGRPTQTGDGFCVRKSYYVPIYHTPGNREGEPREPVVGWKVRLGGCDGIFAHVNPGASAEEAKQVLRWLKWAQDLARSDADLPFGVSCRSEAKVDRCALGARAILASLPLEKTTVITDAWRRPPHNWDVSVVETSPGQLFWETKIDATPGRESIDLAWRIPAPF